MSELDRLTNDQREELIALNKNRRGASFMHCSHWRPLYQRLVRMGLVTWRQHPNMSKKFRLIKITNKGAALLKKIRRAA